MSSHWRPSCLVHSTKFSMRLRHSLTYLLSSVLSPHSTEATSLCPWNFHHTCLLVTGSPPSYGDALFHPFRWVIFVSLGSSRLVSKLLSVVTPLVSLWIFKNSQGLTTATFSFPVPIISPSSKLTTPSPYHVSHPPEAQP